MGLCLCRCKADKEDDASEECVQLGDTISTCEKYTPDTIEEASSPAIFSCGRKVGSSRLEAQVLRALELISTVVVSVERPEPLRELHSLADQERGWLAVVHALIRAIPTNNLHGPALMATILDGCPLPAKETVYKITELFPIANTRNFTPFQRRNLCIILGYLAEKLSGPASVALLSGGTLDYLIRNLQNQDDMKLVLFSLIALEKFGMASENKLTINEKLLSLPEHPIAKFEKFCSSPKFVHKQIGFCAQWVMDNLFLQDGRQFTFENLLGLNINVILNANDVSEYLKLSPNGLSARNDMTTFESVRCTHDVKEGIYYYEATMITSGVMQIGWATRECKFLNHEGYGIGDDELSVSYDGCRRLIWFKAGFQTHHHPAWQSGDVLGCLINLDDRQIIFSLNGSSLPPFSHVFEFAQTSGFFAAASFMVFQQCEFNFGHKPFAFPPQNCQYRTLNSCTNLENQAKFILPKHLQTKSLAECNIQDNSCAICYDNTANMILIPCLHTGFCRRCVEMISCCPMCRSDIISYQELTSVEVSTSDTD